jgi:hypothetical protein
MDKLETLNLARRKYRTFYDKTQLDYSYMEYILEHVEDVSPYRDEIVEFHEKCKSYVLIYHEAIYGQFLRLLEQLLKRL